MTGRQFHQLTDPEIADLADDLVHELTLELRRLEVAGADQAATWQLADELRRTVLEHHARSFRRALTHALEAGGGG